MLSSAMHFWNANLPIVVILSGRLMFINALHPWNTDGPMTARPSGRETPVNAVQFWNVLSFSSATFLGIVIVFNEEQL